MKTGKSGARFLRMQRDPNPDMDCKNRSAMHLKTGTRGAARKKLAVQPRRRLRRHILKEDTSFVGWPEHSDAACLGLIYVSV